MKYAQLRNILFARRNVSILVINIKNVNGVSEHTLRIVPKDHLIPTYSLNMLSGYELSSLLKSETKGYLDNDNYTFEFIMAEKCRRKQSRSIGQNLYKLEVASSADNSYCRSSVGTGTRG